MISVNFKSFTLYSGNLHNDENMLLFFTEQVTSGARSVGKYSASEPKAKTAAERRVHLHREMVVKWSFDHLFHTNHVTDLPQIFESMDRIALHSTEALCAIGLDMRSLV